MSIPKSASLYNTSLPSLMENNAGTRHEDSMSFNRPQQLAHSRSAMNIEADGRPGGLRSSKYKANSGAGIPSWARPDHKTIPNHLTALRHKSSFATPDRARMSGPHYRRPSLSNSPPGNAGFSSFGTPKPKHAKNTNTVGEDELPPTLSIYDLSANRLRKGAPAGSPRNLDQSARATPNSSWHSQLYRGNSSFLRDETPTDENSSPIQAPKTELTDSPQQNSRQLTPDNKSQSKSVIVFGFPTELSSSIVTHFERFGTILENLESSKPQGMNSFSRNSGTRVPIQMGANWIRLTYEDAASAHRAVQENGYVFGGQFIIGCKYVDETNAKDIKDAGEQSMIVDQSLYAEDPSESNDDISLSKSFSFNMSGAPQMSTPAKNILTPNVSNVTPLRRLALNRSSTSKFNQRAVSRTISMPVLPQEPSVSLGSPSLPGQASPFKDGLSTPSTPGKRIALRDGQGLLARAKSPILDTTSVGPDRAVSSNNAKKQSWLSWTSKRAQELVFGWDDL